MSKETGGPAFPMSQVTVLAEDGTPNEYCQTGDLGITMRDYFAAKAMAGYLTGDALLKQSDTAAEWVKKTATAAYEMADAMLAERNK